MSAIPKDCLARVAAAMGTKITPQALTYVDQQIGTPQGATAAALQQAATAFHQRTQLAAVILKRNAALNAVAYQRIRGYVDTTWANKPAEGLRALLTGSIEGRKGARASASREQQMLLHRYTGGLDTDLELAGVRKLFASGAADQEVTRALGQLGQQTPNMAGIGREAQTIAKIIRKWQEVARNDANASGAWIGKLDDWIVSQAHDRWSIESRGFAAWAGEIGLRLDWARIEAQAGGPIADKSGWLSEVYQDIVGGSHLRAAGAQNTSGFVGPANLAKSMSRSRVLHFTSADAWFEYNAVFGKKNLRGAVLHGLNSHARNTGLMRVWGTNPEAMFNRVVSGIGDDLRRAGKIEELQTFHKATTDSGWLTHRLADVTGKTSIPVNYTAAKVGAVVRAVQSMAKLGAATLSSFGDIATYGSELNFQGRSFLSGVGESLDGLVKGRPPTEARAILSEMGVFFDSMIGELARVGSLDDSLPGAMSRGMQHFFRLNLLDWWTETLRSSNALGMLHRLAGYRALTFTDLPEGQRRVFGLYGIEAADWDTMRTSGVIRAVDGRDYLTREGLLPSVGDKLSRYISDRVDQAVIKPDADAMSMMLRSTRPGTVMGELARFIGQFKSYGFGFARQTLGREIYGYGEDAFAAGSVQGIAKLIVASTILGYASITVKEMLKGKKPRDPETPKQWAAVIQASMLQGGGFGIYGDYLFGQYSRFGATPLESAAGPSLGTAADVLKLWAKVKAGDDAGAAAFRLALNNTPYLNLFYVRPVLDHAILYEMQESINPGSLRRLERRAREETGAEYWLPPSDSVQ